jgi:hypothetical protein
LSDMGSRKYQRIGQPGLRRKPVRDVTTHPRRRDFLPPLSVLSETSLVSINVFGLRVVESSKFYNMNATSLPYPYTLPRYFGYDSGAVYAKMQIKRRGLSSITSSAYAQPRTADLVSVSY